jgi:phosphoglycolate phosphatase
MYETILFDLDGTLTDPVKGITRSIQYALAKFGIIEDDTEKLKKFIGPPLAASFAGHYSFSSEKARQAVEYYREYFGETGIFENMVYPGITRLMSVLQEEGRCLFVATSKPTVYARRITDHFGLSGFFTEVVGSNLDGSRVNKAEIIGYILQEYPGVDKKGTVMVGDREHDIIGARANGIASVGVAYGYGGTEELASAGPDHLAESVAALQQLLIPGGAERGES